MSWLWGFERCKFLRLVRLVTNLVLETKPPRFGGVFFYFYFWRSLSFHVIKVEFGSRRWDLNFSVEFRCGGTMPPQLIKATWRFGCVLRQNTWYPVGFIYVVTVKISLPALICKEENLKGRNGGIGFVVMSEKMLHEVTWKPRILKIITGWISGKAIFRRKRPSWFSWGQGWLPGFLGSAVPSQKLAFTSQGRAPTPVFQGLCC